jgi:hypothetical protein
MRDRRQRAAETIYDLVPVVAGARPPTATEMRQAISAGIETATRVSLSDPDVMLAARMAAGLGLGYERPLRAAIKAAFEAAGFEVQE